MQLAVAFGASQIGAMTGVPMLGWLAGSVGGMLLNKSGKKEENATKLNDLKVSSSTYGKGIPFVWGTMRCSGNMIWATDFKEVKKAITRSGKEKSGKMADKKVDKGKAEEVYEYYGNFAMGLCAGVMDDVLRIWADSNCIYDKLNPDKAEKPGFSEGDSGSGGKSQKKGDAKGISNDAAWRWRFYSGTEEQMADPFMVKTQGATKVPAFRGLCYLMFEEMPLKDFGNRIPTITAELVSRKNRRVMLKSFAPMESAVPQSNDAFRIDVDMTRYELVQVGRGAPGTVRVFDVQQRREIARYEADFADRYIGMSADGFILNNAMPDQPFSIEARDTRTGAVVYTIGEGFIAGNITPPRYPRMRRAMVGQGVAKEASGDVSRNFTIMQTDTNDVAVFNGKELIAHTNGTGEVPGPYDGFYTPQVTAPPPNAPFGSFNYIRPDLISTQTLKGDGSFEQVANGVPNIIPSMGGLRCWTLPPIWLNAAQCYILVNGVVAYGRYGGLYLSAYDRTLKNRLWVKVLAVPMPTPAPIQPDTLQFSPIPFSTSDRFSFIYGKSVITVNGTNRETTIITLPDTFPRCDGPQYYISGDHSVLFWGTMVDDDGKATTTWWQGYVDTFSQTAVSISDIAYDVCKFVGIDQTLVDAEELREHSVSGYIQETPGPGRTILEDLMKVYLFDVVESDDRLRFRKRGRTTDVVIPEHHLGVVGDAAENSNYIETRTQEIDLPQTVIVNYIDAKNDYETMSQHFRRPFSPNQGLQTSEQIDINMPLALTPDIAKQMAEKIMYATWAERISHEYVLPWDYLIYDPSDVIKVVFADGFTFDDRLLKADVGGDFSIEVGAVAQHPGTYSSESTGVQAGGRINGVRTPPPRVEPIILDIPYTDDDDRDEIGSRYPLYWMAAPMKPGFRAAGLSIKRPGADYENFGTTVTEGVWGTLAAELPAPPHGTFATDDLSVLRLRPAFDYEDAERYEWESIIADLWPNEDNMVWVDGEIILFRDVEVQEDGTVVCRHLIRGHRGTDPAARKHQMGERWALLNLSGVKMAALPVTTLGETISTKIVAPGPLQMGVPPYQLTFKANGMRPFAPVNLTRKDNDDGSIAFSWKRRTRFGGAMVAATGTVPLNEATESYALYILKKAVDPATFDPDRDRDVVIRKIVTATTTGHYELAHRGVDGVDGSAPIHIAVAQMSASVGMGFPAIGTLASTRQSYL